MCILNLSFSYMPRLARWECLQAVGAVQALESPALDDVVLDYVAEAGLEPAVVLLPLQP